MDVNFDSKNGSNFDKWQSIGTKSKKNKLGSKEKPIDILIRIARALLYIFLDHFGALWVSFNISTIETERVVTVPLEDEIVRDLMLAQYEQEEGTATSAAVVETALRTVAAGARLRVGFETVSHRVGWSSGAIVIDNVGENGDVIIVENGEWQAVSESPKKFRRSPSDMAFPVPAKTGDISLLSKYFTFAADLFLLVLAFLISAFVPGIPHFALMIFGPKGSAKTSFARLLRMLIDPSSKRPAPITDSRDELFLVFLHNYVSCFDNIETLKANTSNILCQAVTGGTFEKRSLYQNTRTTKIDASNVIILTGINPPTSRPDLIERSILVNTLPIADEKRRTERDIEAEFSEDWPEIFAGMLDILARAMLIYEELNVKKLPRMADAFCWGVAIAIAYGSTEEDFRAAYNKNLLQGTRVALEEDPFARLIIAFTKASCLFEGRIADLNEALIDFANDADFEISSRNWPKSDAALSRRLSSISDSLLLERVHFSIHRGKNHNTIRLEYRCKKKRKKPLPND